MGRVLGAAVLSFVIVFRFGAASDDEVVLAVVPSEELQCYECLDYHLHCMTLANTTSLVKAKCAPEEIFCKVQRLQYQEELRTFERGCASSCVPGCERAGDYLRCASCCNTTLCNKDNSAQANQFAAIGWISVGLSVICLQTMFPLK